MYREFLLTSKDISGVRGAGGEGAGQLRCRSSLCVLISPPTIKPTDDFIIEIHVGIYSAVTIGVKNPKLFYLRRGLAAVSEEEEKVSEGGTCAGKRRRIAANWRGRCWRG